jgi:hypothetical protein
MKRSSTKEEESCHNKMETTPVPLPDDVWHRVIQFVVPDAVTLLRLCRCSRKVQQECWLREPLVRWFWTTGLCQSHRDSCSAIQQLGWKVYGVAPASRLFGLFRRAPLMQSRDLVDLLRVQAFADSRCNIDVPVSFGGLVRNTRLANHIYSRFIGQRTDEVLNHSIYREACMVRTVVKKLLGCYAGVD